MTEASDARILAEETAARLNREVVELNDEVASLHSKVAELSETVRATQVHADHDIAGMRARIAGSLTNSLSDLVQTVKEALELDPVGRRQSPKRVRSTSPSY